MQALIKHGCVSGLNQMFTGPVWKFRFL